MSVRNQLRLLVGGLGGRRSGPASQGAPAFRDFLDRSRVFSVCIFFLTVAAILIISSIGMTAIYLPVLPNEVATVRVVAGAPFTYVSEEKTRQARDQLVDPACSAQLAAAWKADLEVHPEAGHDLPLDDGPWVVNQVRAWLEKRSGAQGA